jgi:predicted tellurium resistance membrane protein TerC
MTRMLGFRCCAIDGVLTIVAAVSGPSNPNQTVLVVLTGWLLALAA